MAKIVFEGIEELEKGLLDKVGLDAVKRIVRQNGDELQRGIQNHADFKMGYSTGQTKRSVVLDITDDGLTAESGPTTEYSEYLEKGTRFMSAQPFVKPAFDEQKEVFKKDLKKLAD